MRYADLTLPFIGDLPKFTKRIRAGVRTRRGVHGGTICSWQTGALPAYNGAMSAVLSIMVLAAIALILGAIVLLRRGQRRGQALLMLVLAAVMAANVAIVSLPDAGGNAPLDAPVR